MKRLVLFILAALLLIPQPFALGLAPLNLNEALNSSEGQALSEWLAPLAPGPSAPAATPFFTLRYEDISATDKAIYEQAFALAKQYPPKEHADYFTPQKSAYPGFSKAEIVVCTSKSKTITDFLKSIKVDPKAYFAQQVLQNGLTIIFEFDDDTKGIYIFLFDDYIKKASGGTSDKLFAFALGTYAHELRHFFQHIESPNISAVGYGAQQRQLDIDAYTYGAAALKRIMDSAGFKNFTAARQQAFKDAHQYQTDMMNFNKNQR